MKPINGEVKVAKRYLKRISEEYRRVMSWPLCCTSSWYSWSPIEVDSYHKTKKSHNPTWVCFNIGVHKLRCRIGYICPPTWHRRSQAISQQLTTQNSRYRNEAMKKAPVQGCTPSKVITIPAHQGSGEWNLDNGHTLNNTVICFETWCTNVLLWKFSLSLLNQQKHHTAGECVCCGYLHHLELVIQLVNDAMTSSVRQMGCATSQ